MSELMNVNSSYRVQFLKDLNFDLSNQDELSTINDKVTELLKFYVPGVYDDSVGLPGQLQFLKLLRVTLNEFLKRRWAIKSQQDRENPSESTTRQARDISHSILDSVVRILRDGGAMIKTVKRLSTSPVELAEM